MRSLDVRHRIKINNRLVLNGLLGEIGADVKSVVVLRAIDKLDKVGREGVAAELRGEGGLDSAQIERIFSFLEAQSAELNSQEMLARLRTLFATNERAMAGITQLETLFAALPALGVAPETVVLDLSIARGLDYYTGTVFETICTDLPEIGSICGGGRYDDLASLYTSQDLPGVGASIGIDRLLAGLEELGKLGGSASTAPVLIAIAEPEAQLPCLALANTLRQAGIATEVYPEAKKLAAQLKYADRKGFPVVVIGGTREIEQGVWSLKLMKSGEQLQVTNAEVASRIKAALLSEGCEVLP